MSLFWLLLLLQLLPVWTLPSFPSQDGPLDLYNAMIERDYDRPDHAAIRRFFVPNPRVVPNWVCPHLAPALMRWISPVNAERVILSAYLLGLPLAALYALRGVRSK